MSGGWTCSACGEPVEFADARAHFDDCEPEPDDTDDDEQDQDDDTQPDGEAA